MKPQGKTGRKILTQEPVEITQNMVARIDEIESSQKRMTKMGPGKKAKDPRYRRTPSDRKKKTPMLMATHKRTP